MAADYFDRERARDEAAIRFELDLQRALGLYDAAMTEGPEAAEEEEERQ